MKRVAAAVSFALAACGGSTGSGEEYVGDAATATFHGVMAFTPRGISFRPCGLELDFAVVDSTAGDLVGAFQDLVSDPYGVMYAEVTGRYDPYEATRRPERFLVTELRRSGYETPGCQEDLGGVLFRAMGVQPAWIADIAEDRVMLSAAGLDSALVEFGALMARDSAGLRVFTAISAASDTLRIVIHPVPCTDEETGAHYSFGAEAVLDTLYLIGCAAEGWQ